jgi:hypothetical protein
MDSANNCSVGGVANGGNSSFTARESSQVLDGGFETVRGLRVLPQSARGQHGSNWPNGPAVRAPLGAGAHVPYGFPGILANKDDWALRCGTQLRH